MNVLDENDDDVSPRKFLNKGRKLTDAFVSQIVWLSGPTLPARTPNASAVPGNYSRTADVVLPVYIDVSSPLTIPFSSSSHTSSDTVFMKRMSSSNEKSLTHQLVRIILVELHLYLTLAHTDSPYAVTTISDGQRNGRRRHSRIYASA